MNAVIQCQCRVDVRQSSDAFHHQIVAGQRAGLVKAADVQFTREWNAERLGAEDV